MEAYQGSDWVRTSDEARSTTTVSAATLEEFQTHYPATAQTPPRPWSSRPTILMMRKRAAGAGWTVILTAIQSLPRGNAIDLDGDTGFGDALYTACSSCSAVVFTWR